MTIGLRLRITLLTGGLLFSCTLLATVLGIALVGGSPNTMLVGVAIAVLVSALGVLACYVTAGRVLRPLHQVTAAAKRLSADTFDDMLDRVADAFDSQKRFVANASHELRTPLTVMRTEIDVTLAHPDPPIGELQRMAVVVRDASRRANELIEALLVLARTEAQAGGRLAKEVPVDLALGAPGILQTVEHELQRRGIAVATNLAPAPVLGDPRLLERLAGNLIENAVRHNVDDGTLIVQTGVDGGSAYLMVANSGAMIAPADVPALFDAFRRGGVERTGTHGAGLGLSIVRAVADAHGGVIGAQPRAEGGLEVTVRLPLLTVSR